MTAHIWEKNADFFYLEEGAGLLYSSPGRLAKAPPCPAQSEPKGGALLCCSDTENG